MIALLKSLFNLISVMVRFLEKHQSNRKNQMEIEQHKKAEAYEKLQKALQARMAARKSSASDDIMSDDGYRRD